MSAPPDHGERKVLVTRTRPAQRDLRGSVMARKRMAAVVVAAAVAISGARFCLGEESAPAGTSAAFEVVYAEVVGALVERPEGNDWALERVVFRADRPGAEVERAAL